jgi:type I restriction enzyme, S subunit
MTNTGSDKGKLPDGWRSVKLGDVCDFEYGSGLIEAARREGRIPVYGSNGIVGYHNTSITSGPTIVIGRKGSVGQVHYSPVPCFPIDTTYYIDKVKQPIDLRWFAYILSLLGLPELNKASGVPGLNRNDAYKLMFPLPPLPEQQRIAALLKEQLAVVDKARLAAQARLEAVKALPAAYLRQVFPDINATLPNGWRWVSLGDVCQITAKQVDPKKPEYRNLPHINGENIESGNCRLMNVRSADEDKMTSGKYLFECDDVLYSKLRPYLRKVVVAPYRGVCSADMYPIRCNRDEFEPEYASRLLTTDAFTEYADNESRRARMPKLNRNQLFSWKFPLPPLPEQQRIAALLKERLSAIEQARLAAEAELATINTLPATLLRRAFNGEL